MEFDITRNIKLINILRSDLLCSVADIFKIQSSGSIETPDTGEIAAEIIFKAYLLGKRSGSSFEMIDNILKRKIRLEIINENEVEKFYNDISELSKYLEGR